MNLSIWKRLARTPYGMALGGCILLQGILMSIAFPLLPVVLSNRIGLDKSQVTIFFVMLTAVGIAVSLTTGYLSDGLVARYKLVLVGGSIAAIGYLGIASANQPPQAFVFGLLIVALSVLFPQLFAVARIGILAGWQHDEQVVAITALRTLFTLGFILGTVLASWLVRIIDIQSVFYLIGIMIIVLTAYATTVIYRIERNIAQVGSSTEANQSSSTAERAKMILPLYALIVPLVAIILMQSADSTRLVYLSLVMFQLFQDASIAPLMFGISAAVELFMMSLLGLLAGKIGEKKVIVGGAVVGAVYFLILSFIQSLPVLFAANLAYAVFAAALLGVGMAYIQGLMPQRAGMGGSLYIAVLNLGSLVGILLPLLVTGYDQRIFVFPAILCLVGAGLLAFGDRTEQIAKRLRAAANPEPAIITPQTATESD